MEGRAGVMLKELRRIEWVSKGGVIWERIGNASVYALYLIPLPRPDLQAQNNMDLRQQ